MDEESGTGPLSGYRVLEFATVIAAPLATMLMADQGAEVIKVEPPEGDNLRRSGATRPGVDRLGAIFMNTNRNKRSIVLDLKNEAHLEVARRLAAESDIVVQNYRPGVAERLGIGYEDLRALRQDIIYVSASGLGEDGVYAGRRVYDNVVQGIAGYAGIETNAATGVPRTIKHVIVDKVTALTIWQAATAALLHRERTGEGQHIKVSMLKAALAFLWPDAMSNVTLEGSDVRPGATMADIRRVFPTTDGYMLVGFVSNDEWAGLCRAIGRPELALDPRFATMEARGANVALLNDLVAEAIARRTTSYWLEALQKENAIFAPINSPAQVVSDPDICRAGGIRRHDHPIAGRYVQPGHPIEFGAAPNLPHRHAPCLGADGPDILQELGIDPGVLDQPRRPRQGDA